MPTLVLSIWLCRHLSAASCATEGDLLSERDVAELLAELDGGVPPSVHEVRWVVRTATAHQEHHGTSGRHWQAVHVDASSVLARAELRRAVALWFPRVILRQAIEDVQRAKVCVHGPNPLMPDAVLCVHIYILYMNDTQGANTL